MNKLIRIIAVSLLGTMLLTACQDSDKPKETTTTTTSTKEETPTPTVPDSILKDYNENASISVEYNGQSASGEKSVELVVSEAYKLGKKITVTLPETQKFLAITIAKGELDESILYLKNSKLEYTIPDFSRTYPPKLKTQPQTISARIPTVEELTKSHNIALNTCDLLNLKNAFPHATTTNVHDASADWMARNVIDGFTQNKGHGTYPYQSWGPGLGLSRTDKLTIDFGHDVAVTQLVITIRADFPHDGYWDSCRVYFSDGTYQELEITNSAKGQKIAVIDGLKYTSSLEFKRFEKAKDSQGDWCAWMEVEVKGYEIPAGN